MSTSRSKVARLSLLIGVVGVCALAVTAASAPLSAVSGARADVAGLAGVSRAQTLVVTPWYVASTISNPSSFNIYAPGDLSMHGIGNKTVYEGLAYYSPTSGKSIPWLATSWAYSNNYKTVTVHLRKGVKWSDGVPFTSADV